MAAEDKHSRTEQATAKKRSEAFKDRPPRSREMATVILLMTAFVMLNLTGGQMLAELERLTRTLLTDMGRFEATPVAVERLTIQSFASIGTILAPLLLALITAAVGVNYAQGGVGFHTDRLKFDLLRLNPVTGMGRLFQGESLVELVKSLVKLAVVGYIAVQVLSSEKEGLLEVTGLAVPELMAYVGRLGFRVTVNVTGVLMVIAVLDWAYVRWKFTQDIKMTKEEVKNEMRDQDGDPHVKRRQRQLGLAYSRKQLRELLPQADVVVTNPTHFAVALKYDRDKMLAPVVLLKGADHLALRIKALARELKVPVVENKPLARELFATVKEGAPVPAGLYAAVAEVLTYVYRLKGRI